ncbi:MAG: hypothetical protein ACQESN_11730 [Thermotogota bacterium]
MNEFEKIQKDLLEHFKIISDKSDYLFSLSLEKNELWDIYLNSFEEKDNQIFRERREHDCSACRHFINSIGDTVAIIDNKIVSLWDFEPSIDEYKKPINALSKYVKEKYIKDIAFINEKRVGVEKNYDDKSGKVLTWHHFYLDIPNKFIFNTNNSDKASIQSKYRDIKNVFQRSIEEISNESVETILELINQGSLYKGEEWKKVLQDFKKCQDEYETVKNKDNYLWDKSVQVGAVIGKIRNHSMGTLLVNITEGMELDTAVKKYESMVAPTNYKRPKPIFTKQMLEDAKKKIEDLGFKESLQRRFAILEDISVNNILFANRNISKKLQANDVFEEMEQEAVVKPKSFDKVEEIDIKDFINNVLPTAKNVEVYFENKHSNNMVSLIAPYKADSKSMFKWNNNFSWAYTGNITDSDMKENVKNAGGKVDGVLRFSIQWNDGNKFNQNDFDAHCIEPNKNRIYYSKRNNIKTTGSLDVDIINPIKNKPAVENITWTDKNKMLKGKYKFLVHNYTNRHGTDGFKAEIEFNGEIYKFEYRKPVSYNEFINVADVEFDGKNFTIKEHLDSEHTSKEVWNLKTNNFVPVSVMMLSPNYWDKQGVGNKHYFFMLKDCINKENPNGFFNEFLNNELIQHRKVLEALGSKLKVDNMENQLSGIGFSSTQRNSVVIKVEGNTKRILRIKI